jgi:UPF0755 protein
MKKFSFLIVIILLLVGGVAAWWMNTIGPVNSSDTKMQSFSVKQGEGIKEIASNLKDDGLIKDTVAFFLLVKYQKLDEKIQAGEFYLSPAMDATTIAKSLQTGTYDTRVTIPEGKRAEEVADILKDNLTSYDESWRDQLIANEGYLFPDTYSFAKDADIQTVITAMTGNFEKKYSEIPQSKRSRLTQEELVNIAAMVEREAQHADDRPLVASVILNRLDTGMVLNIDATIQYALGYQPAEKTWWKKHLSLDDLKLASPYNTYTNQGLPPGPISNPGIEVLTSVLDAPETDYLYYVSDSAGHNHYAKTLDEHNANVAKYLK